MKLLRHQRRRAAFLIVALVVNTLATGWHASAAVFQTQGMQLALAGEEIVICSNGVLKRITIGQDGEPQEQSEEHQLAGNCQICAAYSGCSGVLSANTCASEASLCEGRDAVAPSHLLLQDAALDASRIRAPPTVS